MKKLLIVILFGIACVTVTYAQQTEGEREAAAEAETHHFVICIGDFLADRVPVFSQWVNNTGSPIYIKFISPAVVWCDSLSDFFLVLIRVSPSLGPLILMRGDLDGSQPNTWIDFSKSLVYDFVQLNPGDGLVLQTSAASALLCHLTVVTRIDYTVGSPGAMRPGLWIR
jgi:hypothetical protein